MISCLVEAYQCYCYSDDVSLSIISLILSISGNGLCYGVLPVVTAIVPVLKVIDKGTGIECDISVENKDGMSRSMIYKLISSIDERFQILCYLVLHFSFFISWFRWRI